MFVSDLIYDRAPTVARAIVFEAVGLRPRPGDGLAYSIELAEQVITAQILSPGWHSLAIGGRHADPKGWDMFVRAADTWLPEPCSACAEPVWPDMQPAGEPGAYFCRRCQR